MAGTESLLKPLQDMALALQLTEECFGECCDPQTKVDKLTIEDLSRRVVKVCSRTRSLVRATRTMVLDAAGDFLGLDADDVPNGAVDGLQLLGNALERARKIDIIDNLTPDFQNRLFSWFFLPEQPQRSVTMFTQQLVDSMQGSGCGLFEVTFWRVGEIFHGSRVFCEEEYANSKITGILRKDEGFMSLAAFSLPNRVPRGRLEKHRLHIKQVARDKNNLVWSVTNVTGEVHGTQIEQISIHTNLFPGSQFSCMDKDKTKITCIVMTRTGKQAQNLMKKLDQVLSTSPAFKSLDNALPDWQASPECISSRLNANNAARRDTRQEHPIVYACRLLGYNESVTKDQKTHSGVNEAAAADGHGEEKSESGSNFYTTDLHRPPVSMQEETGIREQPSRCESSSVSRVMAGEEEDKDQFCSLVEKRVLPNLKNVGKFDQSDVDKLQQICKRYNFLQGPGKTGLKGLYPPRVPTRDDSGHVIWRVQVNGKTKTSRNAWDACKFVSSCEGVESTSCDVEPQLHMLPKTKALHTSPMTEEILKVTGLLDIALGDLKDLTRGAPDQILNGEWTRVGIVYTAVIELFKKWNSVQMTDLLQFANECNEFLPVIIRVLKLVDICWHSFGESDDPRDLRLNTEQQKALKNLVEMVNYIRHHTCTSYAFKIQLDTNLWTAAALSLTQSNSALEFMTAVSSFQFELPVGYVRALWDQLEEWCGPRSEVEAYQLLDTLLSAAKCNCTTEQFNLLAKPRCLQRSEAADAKRDYDENIAGLVCDLRMIGVQPYIADKCPRKSVSPWLPSVALGENGDPRGRLFKLHLFCQTAKNHIDAAKLGSCSATKGRLITRATYTILLAGITSEIFRDTHKNKIAVVGSRTPEDANAGMVRDFFDGDSMKPLFECVNELAEMSNDLDKLHTSLDDPAADIDTRVSVMKQIQELRKTLSVSYVLRPEDANTNTVLGLHEFLQVIKTTYPGVTGTQLRRSCSPFWQHLVNRFKVEDPTNPTHANISIPRGMHSFGDEGQNKRQKV